MDAGAPTRDALRAGLALVRQAPRAAGAPLTVCAAGWMAVFVAGRADLPPEAAAALAWTGLALVLLMTPPKLGALHRLAAGAEARDPPGPGGLQWTALEARLTATATALSAAAALLFAALAVAAVVATAALRPLGRVEAGPFGHVASGTLLLCPALLAGALHVSAAVGRLCVTLAADATEERPRFARGWMLTRGMDVAAGAVWLLTFATPSAVLLAAPAGLDALTGVVSGARWSLLQAVAVGAALAAGTQFLGAPLNAGALAQLRRSGRLAEAASGRETPATVDTPGPLGDKAPSPRPAAPPSEPQTQPVPA